LAAGSTCPDAVLVPDCRPKNLFVLANGDEISLSLDGASEFRGVELGELSALRNVGIDVGDEFLLAASDVASKGAGNETQQGGIQRGPGLEAALEALGASQ